MTRRFVLMAIGALIMLVGPPAGVPATQRQAAEFKIKAACLYNFLKFVEWPDSALDGDTITIGIVGHDPFGKNFAAVENRMLRAKNKVLIIRRFGTYSGHEDLTACQLLYVSGSERANLPQILAYVEGTPVLTVADTNGFIEQGGMIVLTRENNQIRWHINLTSVEAAGLRVSSQLLRTAVKVVEAQR